MSLPHGYCYQGNQFFSIRVISCWPHGISEAKEASKVAQGERRNEKPRRQMGKLFKKVSGI